LARSRYFLIFPATLSLWKAPPVDCRALELLSSVLKVVNISPVCDNSVTTQQCHNTTMSQHNNVTTQQCHNTTLSQHNSVTTQQCHNTTVSQHNSVTTQHCHNTKVSQLKSSDFSGGTFKSFEVL